ncbi:MAG: hypothetical protein K6F48_08935, partial [Paludibacteraceae bacterium]|nr:hypothetical protein [Paludibacteraceae bacterium]
GTQWGYESMCFNGKYPSENGFTFVPDHTYEGSAFGGMLFVNGDSEIGDVIYSKKINSSRLKGKDVTARCFVNTFADAPNPVKIHLQVTDLKTGTVTKSTSITRNSHNESLDWEEAIVTSSIEGDSILVEIVYDCGDTEYNLNGNDLILDDIQVFVCEEINTSGLNIYCESADGKLTPQKMLWQEDFGTFTSDSTYWNWDYSNLDAPKKVTHKDAKKWSTCYGLEIPRTECASSPFDQGSFTVAGNVTSSADEVGGTQWGYESMCFNGKYPSENGFTFVPDHTYQGSAFGGMLFVNGNSEVNDVIYSKRINSSTLQGNDVTARCFVNTFADAPHPVKIHIQITDLKTGGVAKSTTITRNSQNEGLDWKEATVTSSIEGDSVLVEVVYDCGDSKYNLNGNDLILDDIQVFVCEGESDLPNCIQSKEPIIYANGKDVKSIHLSPDESVTLTSNDVTTTDITGEPYTDFTMSWHKDDATSAPLGKTVGVIANSLEVKWEDADKNGTTFILKVQDNTLNEKGEKIDACNMYDTIIVYADDAPTLDPDLYCLDDEGNVKPMELIWQEDFGTFTSATNYWTWDYIDLSNPTKREHIDGRDWTTSTDLTPDANVTYDLSPSIEGKYCVAANVTCSYDGVQGGTQWGWEAYFGNGQHPKENGWTFVPDHTYDTSAYGGMLFINCDNEQDAPIYTHKISNLFQGSYTALCYVNTFSNCEYPVDIYLQVKDLATGDIYKSKRVTKTSTGSKDWVAARLKFELHGSEIELSVVSYAGNGTSGNPNYNKLGNDLVLDDIQLYACKAYEHVGVETQSAEEMNELVNVYTISGIIVKSNVKRSEALDGLKKGTYYIVGHEKVLVDL